jgi:hypothetical protein
MFVAGLKTYGSRLIGEVVNLISVSMQFIKQIQCPDMQMPFIWPNWTGVTCGSGENRSARNVYSDAAGVQAKFDRYKSKQVWTPARSSST